MALPCFYIPEYNPSPSLLVLNDDTSRHIMQVLRMKTGERISLTDGKGNLLIAEIKESRKKECQVKIIEKKFIPAETRKITIAVSLIKNTSRFEWFMEKAAELGVSEIIPLVCERTEKQKFRADRMQNILVSAMLQSQQSRLPDLKEPVSFSRIISESNHQQKFIAHCMNDKKNNLSDSMNSSLHSQIIVIGPEGDFTKEEIDFAIQHHFVPVSLGETRLRTETAALAASTILKLS